MTSLSLLDHFYPVTSYRRVEKESDELLYTVRSLVMVRNQLPAQVANARTTKNDRNDRLNIFVWIFHRCVKYRMILREIHK